jgi:arylformamidase
LKARVHFGQREFDVDLSRSSSLSLTLDFSASQPRHFGAPPASAQPFAVPGFSGSVETGASCNCQVVTFIPHCNGTHTECVGHLTRQRLDAHRVTPTGLLPALVISAPPVQASGTSESSDPAPKSGDTLVTRRAIEQRWPRELPFQPRALVIRSAGPGESHEHAGRARDPSVAPERDEAPPPYLSRQAAELLVERHIEHLIVDLPSIDRTQDEGRLTAHRIFFGLPPRSRELTDSRRPQCTVTELARVPDEIRDGAYLLEIQVPALAGDAVPSRPLLYALLAAADANTQGSLESDS